MSTIAKIFAGVAIALCFTARAAAEENRTAFVNVSVIPMAYELAPHGVEITIIQPGGYPTKIWDNGRRLTDQWLARVSDEKQAAYETHIQMARGLMSGEYSTNPIDVPNAIAEIMNRCENIHRLHFN